MAPGKKTPKSRCAAKLEGLEGESDPETSLTGTDGQADADNNNNNNVDDNVFHEGEEIVVGQHGATGKEEQASGRKYKRRSTKSQGGTDAVREEGVRKSGRLAGKQQHPVDTEDIGSRKRPRKSPTKSSNKRRKSKSTMGTPSSMSTPSDSSSDKFGSFETDETMTSGTGGASAQSSDNESYNAESGLEVDDIQILDEIEGELMDEARISVEAEEESIRKIEEDWKSFKKGDMSADDMMAHSVFSFTKAINAIKSRQEHGDQFREKVKENRSAINNVTSYAQRKFKKIETNLIRERKRNIKLEKEVEYLKNQVQTLIESNTNTQIENQKEISALKSTMGELVRTGEPTKEALKKMVEEATKTDVEKICAKAAEMSNRKGKNKLQHNGERFFGAPKIPTDVYENHRKQIRFLRLEVAIDRVETEPQTDGGKIVPKLSKESKMLAIKDTISSLLTDVLNIPEHFNSNFEVVIITKEDKLSLRSIDKNSAKMKFKVDVVAQFAEVDARDVIMTCKPKLKTLNPEIDTDAVRMMDNWPKAWSFFIRETYTITSQIRRTGKFYSMLRWADDPFKGASIWVKYIGTEIEGAPKWWLELEEVNEVEEHKPIMALLPTKAKGTF